MYAVTRATPVLNSSYVHPPPPILSELQPLPPSLQRPPLPLPPSQSSSLSSADTLPQPQIEAQWISGRSRWTTFSSPMRQMIHVSGTPYNLISSPPVPSNQRFHHKVGLMSAMSKTERLSMATTRGVYQRRPPQQAAEFWRPGAAVMFCWGPRRGITGWRAQGGPTRYGDDAHHSGGQST